METEYAHLASQWKQYGVFLNNNTRVLFECEKLSIYDLKIKLQTDTNTNPFILTILEEFVKIERESLASAYIIYRTSLPINGKLLLFKIKKDVRNKVYYFSSFSTQL